MPVKCFHDLISGEPGVKGDVTSELSVSFKDSLTNPTLSSWVFFDEARLLGEVKRFSMFSGHVNQVPGHQDPDGLRVLRSITDDGSRRLDENVRHAEMLRCAEEHHRAAPCSPEE